MPMSFPVGHVSKADRYRPRIGITSTAERVPSDPHVSLRRAYVEAVAAAGGLPLVVPILDPSDAAAVLASLDGIVFSGGGDVDPARYGEVPVPEVYGVDQARDGWEIELARVARIPVLGICRGAQVLNVAAGGTLVQHLPDHLDWDRAHDIVHEVSVADGTRLRAVVGDDSIGVNTLHHQAIAEVGDGLRVVARDGDGVVEAIESTTADRHLIAVQWHPELLAGHTAHAALFEWLVERAAGEPRAAVA